MGTILSLINQWDALIAGHVSAAVWWRIGANYLVPFIVSNLGALAASDADLRANADP